MGTVQVSMSTERSTVDLMWLLNEMEKHNCFILVVQDYFNKWAEALEKSKRQRGGEKNIGGG